MYANVRSASLLGADGYPVSVQVHCGGGLPAFTMIGLPDASCREARERVRAAMISSGLKWPDKRITVNLAPVGVRKGGSSLDLAIAVAILVADEEIDPAEVHGTAFLGELGLDGSVRSVPGILPMVACVDTALMVVPRHSFREASILDGRDIRSVGTLAELVAVLRPDPHDGSRAPWPPPPAHDPPVPPPPTVDLAEVRGQPTARRALEVAAAGGHHLLMVGPPGAGKTMLAQRLPTLLPTLDPATALDTTRVHSAAGIPLHGHGLVTRPPFRAPHHNASAVAMVGGGASWLKPGEISIAHGGVLFLDELAEFGIDVIESLRQPLEEGTVRVVRAQHRVSFPARFLLVGAMNPCPCGDDGRPGGCRCSPAALARYSRRLSAPLLDRFDLRIHVGRPEPDQLLVDRPEESSAVVAARVQAARERAAERGIRANVDLRGPELERLVPFDRAGTERLEELLRTGRITGRGLERVRRVALTLADLDGDEPPLGARHIASVQQLRDEPSFLRARAAG